MKRLIDIIELHPSRWQEFKALRLEALKQNPESLFDNGAEKAPDKTWQDRLEEVQRGDSWLVFAQAFDPVQLVGMAGAEIHPKDVESGQATIEDVFVKQDFRREGVGRKLMESLLFQLDNAPEVTSDKLWVNTDSPAVKLYEQLGFGTTEFYFWPAADGQDHWEFRMRRAKLSTPAKDTHNM